jgi:hypothetical protein
MVFVENAHIPAASKRSYVRQHLSITIDADASPSGYIAWYNHHSETSRIRAVRPAARNERFGVQRMELLAIYFALRDNLVHIRRTLKRASKKRLIIQIRSDSKSTVEQLLGMAEVRDAVMRRTVSVIGKLLARIGATTIVFGHLERSRNIAGLMLEQRSRKERERMMELFSARALAEFGGRYASPLCV